MKTALRVRKHATSGSSIPSDLKSRSPTWVSLVVAGEARSGHVNHFRGFVSRRSHARPVRVGRADVGAGSDSCPETLAGAELLGRALLAAALLERLLRCFFCSFFGFPERLPMTTSRPARDAFTTLLLGWSRSTTVSMKSSGLARR